VGTTLPTVAKVTALGIDAGTRDGLLDDQAAQVGRFHAGQRTIERAHGGTYGAQYNDFSLVSHRKLLIR
jgi:hypothetical protein